MVETRLKAPRRTSLMQKLLLAAALAPLAVAAQTQQPRKVLVLDRIVAVVNNEVITRGALDERVRFVTLQLKQQGTPLPTREDLERQTLERMITGRVQLQVAKETGLRVDDVELDRAIQRIAKETSSPFRNCAQCWKRTACRFPASARTFVRRSFWRG